MRLIAYYPTWSIYGPNYLFKNLPTDCLTDVTLAFALPQPDGTLNFEEIDKLNVNELREIGGDSLRIGIAVGGWGTCEEFISATETEEKRSIFVKSCILLISKYNLNYLEIDWEYPSNPTQTNNLKLILEQLRGQTSVQLSICVPCFRGAFETTELNQFVDFIVLMGYDIFGAWSERSGHHSALIPNVQDHARHLIESEGIPANKLILACPLYARTFSNCRGINEPFSGPGLGSFGEQGSLDYKDVLEHCKDKIMYDPCAVSHYSVHGDDFMTFEGPQSISIKCEWVKQFLLGGMAFWQAAGDGIGSDSLIKIAFENLMK